MTQSSNGSRLLGFAFALLLTGSAVAFGQDTMNQGSTSQGSMQTSTQAAAPTRTVTAGEKMKLKGTIVDRDADTFTVRDDQGYETTVLLTDRTSVKSKGGFLRSGQNYDVTNLLRGLAVEVEGRGNTGGQLEASKIRFEKQDLKVARSIETRVTPVEGRLTTVEAQNRTLSGQVDELNEVSKTMRSDIDRNGQMIAATDQRVTATNERISALDDYDVAQQATVLFKVNSAVLTPEAKTSLDQLAQQALATKGYVIEVAGFTDSTGSLAKNRMLSQRRADAVVRYLQENFDIPLRRMITPFGYGEAKPTADNTTREGREQNRRVDVKILTSRGITQQSTSSTQQ
jgi:outer membrane protein OmpA-like peptidoglycan-associated protein